MLDFQYFVIADQLHKEKLALRGAEMVPEENVLIIYDRALFDDKAYITDEQFREILAYFGKTEQEVLAGYDAVLAFHRSGIRIVKLEDAYQMCSASEQAEVVTKTLETRKPPKLSSSQLETLSVIAYYQPATKAYVEQIRGVDSGYSISALLTKKLIREAGRLNVPGRPFQYETTPDFLRVFGLQSLADLPTIEKVELSTNQAQLEIPFEQGTQPEQQKETAQ